VGRVRHSGAGRGGVHDDRLVLRTKVPGEGIQGAAEQLSSIATRDDDAETWGCGWHPALDDIAG
jgi:hypothetical protein